MNGSATIFWIITALGIAMSAAAGQFVTVLEKRPEDPAKIVSPIAYWNETRTAPRPLRIHVLRVDLRAKHCEPVAVIADDPDGNGGAEAQLEKPMQLATRSGVVAAINANAFALFPPPKQGEKWHWADRAPVQIGGWARQRNREASRPQQGYASFWIDPDGRGHTGMLTSPTNAVMAVAGFGSLIIDGQIVDTEIKPLHPRSAVGVDREGRTMWLVVVDGRQPGFSEGMATGELAGLMKDLGCWNAINLDGGGSSILLLAKDGKTLSIMNSPSDLGTRPVPVMLGVRRRE
jgi:hypothetical protein